MGGGVGKMKQKRNSTVSAGVTEAIERNAVQANGFASSLHHNGVRMNVSRKCFIMM